MLKLLIEIALGAVIVIILGSIIIGVVITSLIGDFDDPHGYKDEEDKENKK